MHSIAHPSFLLLLTLLTTLLQLPLTVAKRSGPEYQPLNKTVLTEQRALEPYYDLFNTLLTNKTYSYTPWNPGHIPTSCERAASNTLCPLTQLKAYSVQYSDCPKVWNMCRCDSAAVSLHDQFNLFGKLPVGARSFVRNFMAMPKGNKGTAAYAIGEDIVLTSPVWHVGTLIHEAAHVIDWMSQRASRTQEFRDLIVRDSCVLVAYGNNNYVENFAVMTNLVVLEKVAPEQYKELKGKLNGLKCLENGLGYVRKFVGPGFVPMNTCPKRVPGDGESKMLWRRKLGRKFIKGGRVIREAMPLGRTLRRKRGLVDDEIPEEIYD